MRKQIWMMALLSLSLTVAADEKIIGGTPAPAGAYPFFTSLTKEDGQHLCGGALIAAQWVLTAAHCIRGQSPAFVQIAIEKYGPPVVSRDKIRIAEAFIPADFKGWQVYSKTGDEKGSGLYDIALLKLERPTESKDILKLDGIDQVVAHEVGMPVTLAGFGMRETGTMPNELYHVDGSILEDRKCIDVPPGYPPTYFDPLLNVCSSKISGGGDSGGPLLFKTQSGYVGVALVSRGLLDASQMTRISFYKDWITDIMANDKCGQQEKPEGTVSVRSVRSSGC
ncbi:S1 family peptidase [Pseudomonas syringae]|uniref:S1 family peptidase n=1 Tax=Pseudomonas syringae TaxID=317 RepID=UPI00061AF66B|nr:serine protease [Pseudomonas syringae]